MFVFILGAWICRGQRSTLDVFLDQFKPCILRQSLYSFSKRTDLIEIYIEMNDIYHSIYNNVYVIYENGL